MVGYGKEADGSESIQQPGPSFRLELSLEFRGGLVGIPRGLAQNWVMIGTCVHCEAVIH